MRHAATYALLIAAATSIIVASVSCIYGIGAAEAYLRHDARPRRAGVEVRRDARAAPAGRDPVRAQRRRLRTAARSACAATSSRSSRPTSARTAIRIELFGDEIETISEIDPLRGKVLRKLDEVVDLPRLALRDAGRPADARDRRASRTSCASGSSSCKARQQAARGAAARAADACTTSRCSSRWATARASRTTRATCRAARRASRRRR